MTYMVSNAVAIAMCNANVDLIDVGGAGTIEIRTGAPPANVEAADSGSLIATLGLNATAFGAAADINPGARATANAITSDTDAEAGMAAHFRIKTGGGTAHSQGTCGAGSGDLSFNTVDIVADAEVAISALTVTVPES
jgi:hypothetical protein